MPWVRNEAQLTPDELADQMRHLHLDTAAAGADSMIAAALEMTSVDHLVYGGDSGVPCTDDGSVSRNIAALRTSKHLTPEQFDDISSRAGRLFIGDRTPSTIG